MYSKDDVQDIVAGGDSAGLMWHQMHKVRERRYIYKEPTTSKSMVYPRKKYMT